MLIAVVSGLALMGGVPLPLVISGFFLSRLPLPYVTGILGIALLANVAYIRRGERSTGVSESDLLRQISGRVAAGATIRSAIVDTGSDANGAVVTGCGIPQEAVRLAALGHSMEMVGDALIGSLPTNGAAFRGICSFSEHTGAAISSSLAVLAEQADEVTENARQKRVSLAQVKLSAVIIGVVPLAASVALVVLRGVPEPGGSVIILPMIAGALLQIMGTAVVFTVASRSTSRGAP